MLLLALAAHARALGLGWVWLDSAHVVGRAAIVDRAGWLSAWTQGFAGTGYYRPLTTWSLSLDAALGGGPRLFHATNLALHAGAALAVLHVARSLGVGGRCALVGSLLFAVHPLGVEVASCIAFRSESLLVLTLTLLVLAERGERAIWAGCCCFAAASVKETGLLLAPLVVAALELHARRPGVFTRQRYVLLALAASLALRWRYAPPWRASQPDLGLAEQVGTRLAAFARAARDVALPFEHTVCDTFRVTSLLGGAAVAGLVALALLVPYAWRRGALGWICLAALLPIAQIVPVTRWWSLHYLYLPWAFGAPLVAEALAQRLTPRALTQVVAGLVVAGVLACWHHTSRYADDGALWEPEVQRDPSCREGHFYLGEQARSRGALDAAAAHYRAALAPTPGVLAYVDAFAVAENLGSVQLELGDSEGARQTLRTAFDQVADPPLTLRHDLAVASLRARDPAGAWRALAPLVDRADTPPETLYLAAKALHELGRDAESRPIIERIRRSGWAPAR